MTVLPGCFDGEHQGDSTWSHSAGSLLGATEWSDIDEITLTHTLTHSHFLYRCWSSQNICHNCNWKDSVIVTTLPKILGHEKGC